MNLLFVCSRNQWRSPTAETIFKNNPDHVVRSAGTSNGARIKVSQKLLDWAECIFVMETKHRSRLREKFGNAYDQKIIVLDIPDDYPYMDPELIQLLTLSVSHYLE